MEPQQKSFDTFGRWMLTRLSADLAPVRDPSPGPLALFFNGLYRDMLEDPAAYCIPVEPFIPFYARTLLTPAETAQHEALKAARMRVRKVVLAYLEFLYHLGRAGAPVGEDLQLPLAEFESLVAGYSKKVKPRYFLAALERCGLSFSPAGSSVSPAGPLVVSNTQYPGMPAALAAFSQACARVKDFDFYLFRRCDLAVLDGKAAPDFSDALRLVPLPFQREVAETDDLLRQMRFKREIFVDGCDMTYRLRYSKKDDQVVYWCRIQETFQPDLRHYLRWKLDSDLTPRLFSYLDKTCPGLADHVFAGLKSCAHCYGDNCMARVNVERDGVVKAVCKENGWNQIGYTRAAYENLRTVIAALSVLTSTARN